MLLLPCLALVGCGSEPSRYAAKGTVTIDGVPAPFVVVKFRSEDPKATTGGTGATDPAGKFVIGEDGKNTGLPAGDYKVTFSQTLVNGKPTLAGSGGKKQEKEKTEKEAIPADYRDPQKTPHSATIGGGANDFAFEIKVKA